MQLRAGYVEAVATLPARQREGFGSLVMTQIGVHLRDQFEMGAFSTGKHSFYERNAWQRWRGRCCVRDGDSRLRTPDEDV